METNKMTDRKIWIEEQDGEKYLFGVALVAGQKNKNGWQYKLADLLPIAESAQKFSVICSMDHPNSLQHAACELKGVFIDDGKIVVKAKMIKDTKYLAIAEFVNQMVAAGMIENLSFTISCVGAIDDGIVQNPAFDSICICRGEDI
jgi:hypothetical protein